MFQFFTFCNHLQYGHDSYSLGTFDLYYRIKCMHVVDTKKFDK